MDPKHADSVIIDMLKAEVEKLSLGLTAGQLADLNKFLNLLAAYNEKINLVSDASPELVARTHVLDCLTVADAANLLWKNEMEDRESISLVDIGSGAGFPGMVIAIAWRQATVVLIEAIAKKARFLSEVVEELNLGDRVKVMVERGEDVSRTRLRETFNFATARAVGHLGMVAELTMPFLTVGGHLLCQKSANQAEDEIRSVRTSLQGLGADEPRLITPEIQTGKNRHVIVDIPKIARTASAYPRSWSQIVKQWKQ